MIKISKIWNGIMKITEAITVMGLIAIWLVLFYQVIMRFVFNNPPVWTEELSMSLIIWVCFFGVSYGVHNRMHIRMTTLVKYFSRKGQAIIAILMDIIMLVAVCCILPYSWEYFISRSAVTSTTMRISNGFVMVSLPIGYFLLILSLIDDIIRILKGDLPNVA